MRAVKRAIVTGLLVGLGLAGVGTGFGAAQAQATGKDAQSKAHRPKRAAKPMPAPPAAAASSPTGLPMDFSGMSRSVNDLNTPSNARANTQFNPEGGGSGGFSPGATFKF